MSYQLKKLPQLELVSEKHLEEALKALIHSILFARCLFNVRPKERFSKFLDLQYTSIEDAKLDDEVNRQLLANFSSIKEQRNGTLSISFYTIEKEETGYIMKEVRDKRIIWEKWIIPLQFDPRPGNIEYGAIGKRKVREAIRDIMMNIFRFGNETDNNIPVPRGENRSPKFLIEFNPQKTDTSNLSLRLLFGGARFRTSHH